MNSNKKIVIAAIVMLLAVFCVMSACKKNIANSGNGEVVVVTDENGVPITDENGEAVTVVLDTTIVNVTNENGELVYDEDGNVKTSVVYISKEVGIPRYGRERQGGYQCARRSADHNDNRAAYHGRTRRYRASRNRREREYRYKAGRRNGHIYHDLYNLSRNAGRQQRKLGLKLRRKR